MKKSVKLLEKFIPVLSFTAFVPFAAYAQGVSTCTEPGIAEMICRAQHVLNAVVPILVALGVVYFVWGVVQYMIGDSEEAKKKGRDHIIYGIIGLAVIISVWGLVYIVVDTFNLDEAAPNPGYLNGLLPQR